MLSNIASLIFWSAVFVPGFLLVNAGMWAIFYWRGWWVFKPRTLRSYMTEHDLWKRSIYWSVFFAAVRVLPPLPWSFDHFTWW